jgi:arylsulfatase A-like enzyme
MAPDDDGARRAKRKRRLTLAAFATFATSLLALAVTIALARVEPTTCPTGSEASSTIRPLDARMARPLATEPRRNHPGSNPETRPNILLILTDDQWNGSMSVMPNTRSQILNRGTAFTNAYVTTPLCCPSRSSILTGTYAHNHGVRDNLDGVESVFDSQSTVERYLRETGYRTALFGKFLNGWPIESSLPYFDRWAFIPRVSDSGAFCNGLWNVNGDVRAVSEYSTTFINRQAVAFLNANEARNDSRPWFLFLATPAPHLPAIPETKYAEALVSASPKDPASEEQDVSDKPPYLTAGSPDADVDAVQFAQQQMLRSLMSVDDMVGSVFRTLRSNQEVQETLVIFLSDNGFLFGQHGLTGKGVPYSDSIGVPMALRWPGHVAAGAADSRIAANIDIAPTILQAAGIDPDPGYPMDGRSLLEPSTRTRLLTEYWKVDDFYVPSWASLRTTTFQYVEYYAEDGSIIYREYYNLVRDPDQLVNVLGDADPFNDPADLGALHGQLAHDRKCAGSACP